jgi:DMSO/TMAO reductase YedYZ molybdopterin-dependent catalytic subunit
MRSPDPSDSPFPLDAHDSDRSPSSPARRDFFRLAAAAGAGMLLQRSGWAQSPTTAPKITSLANRSAPRLVKFPEKTDLILLTERPPNLETPIKYFRQDITPNEAFFVRWHYSGVPTEIDAAAFRLSVGGHVAKPLSLSLDDLKTKHEPVSLIAVAQCSGNSRSFFDPRVNGGQWGHGAVGNVKWTGVRLRDLLKAAGVKDGAIDVTFSGLDRAVNADSAHFVKSLPFERANDGEEMVAYAMNDQPLPMLNGFPLRLVVPGWYATYWVKTLNEINVLPEEFTGFWMKTAYRIPNNADANESPKQLATDTVPINGHSVHAIFVTPEPGARAKTGTAVEVEGVAIDDGAGITRVEVSTDGGKSWQDAKLDPSLGKYAWRRWRYQWKPPQAGTFRLMARATNAAGRTQTTQQWNRSGYQRNVIEHVDVVVG